MKIVTFSRRVLATTGMLCALALLWLLQPYGVWR